MFGFVKVESKEFRVFHDVAIKEVSPEGILKSYDGFFPTQDFDTKEEAEQFILDECNFPTQVFQFDGKIYKSIKLFN